MKINVGSNIRWVSAAGVLTGEVTSIRLAPNAAGSTIPWMLIDLGASRVMLPGTDSYFSMMKLEVLE